jgi:hypothetical protein
MPESISVKRKVGRPATGVDRLVAARMPEDMISSIEAWAAKNGVDRSEAIRRLVELGLRAKGQ